jgi:hypothetical protein
MDINDGHCVARWYTLRVPSMLSWMALMILALKSTLAAQLINTYTLSFNIFRSSSLIPRFSYDRSPYITCTLSRNHYT